MKQSFEATFERRSHDRMTAGDEGFRNDNAVQFVARLPYHVRFESVGT
jgi:hypothetical protein